MITFLGAHPEWRTKAKAEIEGLLFACSVTADASSPSPSLSSHLSVIPLGVWESQTPVLDSIIQETLRVAQPHAAMRRNIGKEVCIDDKVIPTGAYVLYPFSDVHLNPDLCQLVLLSLVFEMLKREQIPILGNLILDGILRPKPRIVTSVGEEVRLGSITMILTNSTQLLLGKTLCLGSRLAKLELKLITSMFLLGFDHVVVDKMGLANPLPRPNWNDTLHCRPVTGSCYIKYERSSLPL